MCGGVGAGGAVVFPHRGCGAAGFPINIIEPPHDRPDTWTPQGQ